MILLAILFAASQSGEGNLARQNTLGNGRVVGNPGLRLRPVDFIAGSLITPRTAPPGAPGRIPPPGDVQ
jgi:hypothetical protein